MAGVVLSSLPEHPTEERQSSLNPVKVCDTIYGFTFLITK